MCRTSSTSGYPYHRSCNEPVIIFRVWRPLSVSDVGEIEPDMMYEDRGSIKTDEFKISNLDNLITVGVVYIRNTVDFSCLTLGMINIVQRVGKPLLYANISKIGLGDIAVVSLSMVTYRALEAYEKWPKTNFYHDIRSGYPKSILSRWRLFILHSPMGGIYMQPYIV